jgi:hypothetical protein
MKPVLIVQFKTSGRTDEFDWLIKIEDALIQAYSQNNRGKVDGHDFGSGVMNIFIFPKESWRSALEILIAHLKHQKALSQAVVILRTKVEKYTVVWPENFTGEFSRT